MSYEAAIVELTRVVETVGILVLLIGGLLAALAFVREWRRLGLDDGYHRFRANLGRAILLGLEILIVADIIATVAVQPTLANLGALGLLVLIRTFLSFALEIEISGTLPWHRAPLEPPHQAATEPEPERSRSRRIS